MLAAELVLRQSQPEAAERYARDALPLAEAIARGPDTSAEVGEMLLLLAKAELAQHRTPEARVTIERALRCLSNGYGANFATTLEARELLRAQG
jgi:hypothetical protein